MSCGVPPEHRSAVKVPLALSADASFAKINVIPVWRENQGVVDGGCRRDDLSIAARWHVAQPQALEAIIVLHIQNIFAVGRDCSLFGFARVRDLRDREILKWCGPAAADQ